MVSLLNIIYVFTFFVSFIDAKKITILVLGSHIDSLLQDRMQTAINFAQSQPKSSKITWYLSGGIKNKLDSILQKDEAEKMKECIPFNSDWNFIVDTKASNTAENFAYFRKWLENTEYSNVYIVTSEFHYNRAKSIIEGIIPNLHYNFLLSKADYSSSTTDEIIHSRNIKSDVKSALDKYNLLF